MPIADQLTAALREINTRRREQEQALQRNISERTKEAEDADASLPHLDRELAERVRRIREEIEAKKTEQRTKADKARKEVEQLRGNQDVARTEADEKLWSTARESAGKVVEELRARERFVRQADEELRRREQVLATHPELAKTLEEYEQNCRFLESLGATSLPGATLDAIKGVVTNQVSACRDRLRKKGIQLDAVQPPEPDDILLLFETGELRPGLSGISVLTPCTFGEYERPNLESPGLPLRVAGVVVRAVATALSALSTEAAPILYQNADGFLVVTGICGEGMSIRDAQELFEIAAQDGTPAIADAVRANLRLMTFALPPGLLGKFIGTEGA